MHPGTRLWQIQNRQGLQLYIWLLQTCHRKNVSQNSFNNEQSNWYKLILKVNCKWDDSLMKRFKTRSYLILSTQIIFTSLHCVWWKCLNDFTSYLLEILFTSRHILYLIKNWKDPSIFKFVTNNGVCVQRGFCFISSRGF